MKKGITLIALIITVIILLILAGTAIAISINGGDIFTKTSEAREKWNLNVEEEQSSTQEVLDILDMAVNPDLAKYKLTVKVNEDDTVESPYYVNYPSKEGTIKCRVLYNDSKYGLQIISVSPVTKVRLGKNDENENVEGANGTLERAQNSYNRAILSLNEAAEKYLETIDGSILATDARCVGSNPLDKNYPDRLSGQERQSQMYVGDSSHEFMNDYNGKFFKGDKFYYIDGTRLVKIGAYGYEDTSVSPYYWFASRKVDYYEEQGYLFFIYMVQSNGSWGAIGRLNVPNNGTMNAYDPGSNGLRPVFVLASNVKVIGGEGTEENPFELGL